MKVLFDLRSQLQCDFVSKVNDNLAREWPGYLERYGAVASSKWWRLYEQGHISRTECVGEIVHVGPTTDDFNEACDLVRIDTDRGEVACDREGCWVDPEVAVGRWVHLEYIKVIVQTSTGPIVTIIDTRIWLE